MRSGIRLPGRTSLSANSSERLIAPRLASERLRLFHAELVRDLSGITGQGFEMTDVSQVQESEETLRVRFVHAGRGFSFLVQHMGRYYDLRSVLTGLNGILENLGREERFLQLHCGGVVALITFAPEKKFLEAARKLRIPVELDPDAARRAGVAYTNYVLSPKK